MTAPSVHTREVGALTPVPEAERQRFLALPPERAAHDAAFAEVAAFAEIEIGRRASAKLLDGPLRVAAWNLERCLYPEAASLLLRRAAADLVLLTEMDNGCHRTGQRHTIADVAGALGHRYAYAAEFLELRTMPQPVKLADTTPGNRLGFHGNGLTTALQFRDPWVIRLDEVADWFAAPKGGQRRIGKRMAVAATLTVGGREFVACSVHLESACDAAGRTVQMRTLLDALDAYAGGRPVVIGGDLNTAVEPGGYEDAAEPLFAEAAARGYDWRHCNVVLPTTRASVWSASEGTHQLDWFCTRGFTASAPEVIPALGEDHTVLTDHDLIVVTLRVA
jgi:endonuclease/exonuclease/phosphatase family metal-dependent hydrolase